MIEGQTETGSQFGLSRKGGLFTLKGLSIGPPARGKRIMEERRFRTAGMKKLIIQWASLTACDQRLGN
jgi:hypothetical protein